MLLKVGGVNQLRVEKQKQSGLEDFLIAVIPKPVKRHKKSLMYFLNVVTLHDVIYLQYKGFSHLLFYLFSS